MQIAFYELFYIIHLYMTSNQYIFLRHGQLDLPYKDHAEMPFNVFADLGSGVLNPPINTQDAAARIERLIRYSSIANARSFLISPAKRCQNTAGSLVRALGSQVTQKTVAQLAEIEFDLRALNTDGVIERALRARDIASVNNAIFAAMLSGTHGEAVADAYRRVEMLFKQLRENTDKSCLCITHDFLMRVIEIYIKRRGAAFKAITLAEFQQTHRNDYLSGFAVSAGLQTIERLESSANTV
ncbi:phosphoglycerate mutase family protein [Candidatus Kaiserbacteria bacterium]|nr:phosphoglycerate mutase family protein [Candidatus Kaiserbacteria bacterium]